MQWLIRLFLPGTLFESRPLSSESEFDNLLELIIAGPLAANFNDSFHVASFGSNESPCHLKFLVIFNLNVKPAGILNVLILVLRALRRL